MKKIILMLLVLNVVLLTACSQNANRQSAKTDSADASSENTGMKLVKPAEMLPEIESIYSGIKVVITNKKDNKKIATDVPFNKKTALGDSGLELEVSSYFTNFVMMNGMVVNRDMEEKNPAAKVVIYKNGIPVFDGWLFQLYPDMHSFEDSDWSILMNGSVKK